MDYVLEYFSKIMEADVKIDISVIVEKTHNYDTPQGKSPDCLVVKDYTVNSGEIHSPITERYHDIAKHILAVNIFHQELQVELDMKKALIIEKYRKEYGV